MSGMINLSNYDIFVYVIISFKNKTHSTYPILDCDGQLKPEVVQSTAHSSGSYPASNVLILGETDGWTNGKTNFWVAEWQKTTGQGFTIRLDACARMIASFQIKNLGKGGYGVYATKNFKISGSHNENGPWKTLMEDQLIDTRFKDAPLLNFTFDQPVEIQFIKFDLVSYWGSNGGALQYFAAILATSKKHQSILK